VALPSARYEPRRPAEGVLYEIVQASFETFRAQAASLRDGEGLPRFVEEEFRAFLRCGSLAGGFARFRCTACGLNRLVAFSCCPELKTIWSLSPEVQQRAARIGLDRVSRTQRGEFKRMSVDRLRVRKDRPHRREGDALGHRVRPCSCFFCSAISSDQESADGRSRSTAFGIRNKRPMRIARSVLSCAMAYAVASEQPTY